MACSRSMASRGKLSLRRGVLDADVNELFADRKRVQDHLRHTSYPESAVDACLGVFRVPYLAIVLIDDPVQGIADGFHHVIVIERRVRTLEEIHNGAFQESFQGYSGPSLCRFSSNLRLPRREGSFVLRLV